MYNLSVADVAQLAEHQVVVLGVVGSIPIVRPFFCCEFSSLFCAILEHNSLIVGIVLSIVCILRLTCSWFFTLMSLNTNSAMSRRLFVLTTVVSCVVCTRDDRGVD